MMRRIWPLVVLMVLGMAAFLSEKSFEGRAPRTVVRQVEKEIGAKVVPTRKITHIGSAAPSGELPAADPIAIATQILESHREEWQLRPYHTFEAEAFTNPLSTSVKFQVYQGRLPVLGMTVEMEFDRDLRIKKTIKGYKPIAKIVENPEGVPSQWVEKLSDRFQTSLENLVKASPVIFYQEESGEAQLAYVIRAVDKKIARPAQILIRAADGQVLKKNYPRAD